MREVWQQLRAARLESDELWRFRSPPETWAALVGEEGYVIVRDGVPFKGIITFIN